MTPLGHPSYQVNHRDRLAIAGGWPSLRLLQHIQKHDLSARMPDPLYTWSVRQKLQVPLCLRIALLCRQMLAKTRIQSARFHL